jgi:hypothetical protein
LSETALVMEYDAQAVFLSVVLVAIGIGFLAVVSGAMIWRVGEGDRSKKGEATERLSYSP